MRGRDTEAQGEDAGGGQGPTKGPRRRLWWLIAIRLAALSLLAGAALLWGGGDASRGVPASGVRASFVGFVALLTVAYALALRFSRLPLRTQAGAQLLGDVLLVTWLVREGNELHSPFVALYILIVSAATAFLGARGAIITSVGCAFCYTAVTLAAVTGWPPGARSGGAEAAAATPQAFAALGLNVVGIFVVGLLAARLAERQSRSDVQLQETTHALTHLRALHERIVESIRSGVITTDLAHRVFTINAAGEEMTGYDAAVLRGQDVSILFGDISAQIEESLRAASEERTSPRFEAECLTAEGLRVRLGYSVFPLAAEEGGAATGLVITFQDLTHVRAMEETSRRQERLSAVGRVAAGIAHEVRNPLAAMRGSIQVLQSEMQADPAQAELMGIVLRESDRLNRIITDFLTYARPRPVELKEIDLREPLRETFTLLRHSPELREGHSLTEALPDAPVSVQADAAGVRQVFWNLTRNALAAMPEGGDLRAELSRDEATRRARVTFTDTGRGMTPEQVERLFEPFTSSNTGGTGLGLSIVYQIVRDHGGTINVRSREGHGTVITVELPAATTTPPATKTRTADDNSSNGGGAPAPRRA